MKDGIKIKGMFRLRIVNEDGSIAGESGWLRNTIVNDGYGDYLCALLGKTTGSKQVTHMALGTGTAPAATATVLAGELDQTSSRAAVAVAVSNTSKKVTFTATFASAASFVSTTMTLQNIGLFNTSAVTAGTIFAGNTFATSTCAVNQTVNATYTITFT